MKTLGYAATAGLLALVAGCATGSAGNPYSDEMGERREIRIDILNHNFSDATVWAIARAGHRQRLGIVTGKTDSTFTLEWRFSVPLRLEFDMVAGPRCTTEALSVDPGDILQLEISTDMQQMSDWCR